MRCRPGDRPRAFDMGGTPASPTAPQMTDVATNRCGEPMTRPRGNPGRRWGSVLPTPPTPAFDKTGQLYETLTNYPVAAKVEIGGSTYLLYHNGGGEYVIGVGRATGLYEIVNKIGLKIRLRKNLLVLTHKRLEELRRHGVQVQFLNEMEKAYIEDV